MKFQRQFWSGVLVGLSAGSLIRRGSAGGLRQSAIRRIYDVWAPAYSLANVYLLGQLPRLRRTAVARLALQPGDSVLELSCGTGANFPYVEAGIGPGGRLVGLDYTPSMLAQARDRVEKHGWQNVALVHGDAAQFEFDERFDAVLWVLAASVVPDWRGALARAAAHLKPGGRLVIADARLSERWYVRPFNWLADLMGLGAAADISRRPWDAMPEYLSGVGYEELLMGFLYVAWGIKRTDG